MNPEHQNKIVAFPHPGPAMGSAASDSKHPAAGLAGAPPPDANEFADGLMSVAEAASRLGVCRVTIYNLADARELVATHSGWTRDGRRRQMRISRRSINRYLARVYASANHLNHETQSFDQQPLRRAA